ncbi:hypothetical protein CHLRE_09g403367v5 [Chlamydomonas reinhardtii]|uniref:Ubiquitin-like domain-containing protein n=3 Tax=Chlamydomonas reinhardtii TaxID=3055 RepID=A0A2K3DF67_CHLRE|nr:uncharacterized protein CHLRE_09g403367v5 [Chlamydomonas reinhardtii]PNW79178.1 hypothetical protein CHLRE_09g403367v5 [Chlamydomonas reinhardtii]
MQVFVRTLSGKTGVVSVLPCDPAAVLLLSTAANEGVPPVLLRLLWRSRRVRLHRSFAAQGILPGSTVFVTSVLYGGVGFTEAEVRRVCDAVEKLARRDAGACARMEAGQWEPLVQVLAHQSTASPAVVEAVLRERAATIRAAVAVAGITHRMFAARTAKQQAARAAAAGSVAGSVQASAGGAPGTSAVGASPAAGTGPGSAGAAASRYSGAAGAPSAAQHKVIAAPGARLASVPQQPRTVRQRAQAEAFKSMMGQGLDEGSRAHAAAQTCTFTRPEPPAPPAPAAREGQPQGRYVTDVIDGIVGVLRQHRDLASILHRKEMNMLLPGELKQLAEALQQQLPEKLRSSSVHGMETWLHHHVDEIELALAGVPNPDAVAAAAGVGGAAMPWEVQLGLQRVAEMMGLASDAEKQPAAEAWQERQWHTLTDCISATRAAARVAGDTAGAAGAAVSTGGAQTAAGGVPDIATSRLCDDAAAAQAMRQQMAAELPTQPCCVCGRRRRQRDVHWHRVSGLREWLDEQLSVMLPGTAEAPRDGNTLWAPPTSAEAVALLAGATGAASMPEITERVMREGPASGRTVYRLQAHPAAGTVQLAADGDHQLRVCVDCMRAHQHGHLPPLSYACVDNGLRPSHLPQLTVMEERLVAVWRPLRNLMVCRPPAAGGGPGHWEMRAHVIAFKAPEPQQLAAVFPCSLARVPECITVVFVSPAQTYQQLEALARRVPALMVRGKVVAAWARHLAALYPSARLDEAAVQEWERQPPTAVADTLARRAVCTQTQGEASALLRTLRAEQEGYARARYGTAEEAAARGASTAMAVAVNSDSSSGSDSEAIIVQQSLARPSRKRSRLLSAAHMQRLLCGLDRDASVAVRQLLLAHNFKAAATKLLRHHGGAPTKEAVTQMQVQLQTQHCNYEQVLTDHERALIAEANASGSTRPLSRPPAGAPLPPGSLFVVHEPQALSPVQREHGGRRPQSLPALPAEAAQRAGAAAPAAAAAGAEVAAAFSSCGQNVTHMQGIDDVDLSPTPADSPALRAVFEDACADERALQLLLDGWPLASCTEQAPQSDYQPEWPLRVHVNRFPNGTGACPAGMQMLSWIQLQLQRWYPPAPDGTEDCSAQANASGSTRPLSRPPAGAPLPPGSLFVVHEPQALSPVQREHGGRRPQSLPALPAEAAQRAGAAAPAAAAAGAEVAAAFSSCGQNVTHMQGIDDVDLSPTPADSPALRAVFEDACADERALQLLLDGWPLASCTEQAPQSDYQPEWPLRVHVNRFPNGTGACPAGMQMLSWIQLQLQRWYPPAPDGTEDCSAQAPHFILDMFDAWQRHTVNQQVAVRFKLDPQLIMSLGDMGPDTLVEAADVLAAGLSRAEQAQRLHGSPPEVEQLVRGARITGAHVVGSPGSYAALRSRAYGLWAAYGPPSATVTLNPASVHSDATFTLMGRPYTFDVRTGAPQHRPMAAERWDLVAGHPLACAESFEAFMDAFCDVFLGWPAGSDVQQRSNCLFGRVDAFFFKFEMNQRGELHVHGCIWQPGLQPARLRKALADPRNCPDVLDFLESVQTQWFASPLLFSGGERPVHAQKLSTEQLQEVAEAAGSERLTELQRDILREVLVEVKARGAMEDAAVSCRPPLQCSSLTEAERLGLFAAHAVLETLLHAHRDGTCTTSHSKHATDSNCRMRLPRMLHWLTTYLHEQSVCVHLKRYGRYMVSHMVALLLAVPCNHTVTFACDVGRWLRTRELWDQRHEGIPRTDPVWERRPQLPSLEQLAADAADYALKYATKSEAVQGSRALIAAATMLRRRMHLMTPEQQAGIESEHLPIQDVLDQLRHPFAAFADASASAWAPRPPTAGVSAAGESSTPAQAQFTAEVTARAQQSATVAALRTARPVGAAAVQREGMFNLAHAINLLTAQQTFSAPAAALLLMRGTDAHESHQFRAIDYRMFSQHVQSQLKRADPELRPRDTQLRLVCTMGSVGAGGSPTGEGQLPAASTIASDVPDPGPSGSVQQLEQPAVAPARYRSSSYLKDYLYRGEALRELSPMMMAMLFYKHSAGPDGAQGHHLRLHPAHPEYSKCVWRRRLRPYVPQPVCDPVVRPADGVGDPQVLERYAVFALANFAAYSCDDMLDLSNGAWAAYQRCFAQPADGQSLHVRIACRMLDHVDGLARVRMRAEERRQLQAEAEGTAEDVAEEALLEGVPLEGMDDLEAEPQDDEEPDVRRSAAPAAELWQGCALSETERAGLLQRIVHGGLGGGLTTEATTVVAQIPRANAWPAVGRTAAAAVVRSTQEWTHERLAAAQQRMHDYDLGGQYAAQALAQAQGAVQQQLLLYNSGTAAVTAKLVLISPLAVTTAAPEVQGVWPDAANPGAEPPYVLCPEDSQPTPEDTARLWNLSDDQQQAFMLYAQLLLAEAAGVRQPPVCSVLTGKAGSGKSRVLQALLWFAYQHRCESLIALVSYTWRAALHLPQPRHVPLYSGAAEESLRQLLAPGAGDGGAMERQIRQLEHPEGSMNLMGRELWNMVPFAFVLTHQHRQQAGVARAAACARAASAAAAMA